MESQDRLNYMQLKIMNNSFYGSLNYGNQDIEELWREYERKLLIKHRTDTIYKLLKNE